MVKRWALILLSLFSSCNHAFAQVGPGGLTPRNCLNITDGSNTVSCASKLTVSGGTVSGSNPNATLTVSGGGSIGIGTVNQEAVYTTTTSVGPGIITDTGSAVGIGTTLPMVTFDMSAPTWHNEGTALGALLPANVGIGTMTDGSPLTVYAEEDILGDNASSGTDLIMEDTCTSCSTDLEMQDSNSNEFIMELTSILSGNVRGHLITNTGLMGFGFRAFNENMMLNSIGLFINASGTSPINGLDLNGSFIQGQTNFWAGVNVAPTQSFANEGGISIGTWNNQSAALVILSDSLENGNVGIGSLYPSQILDVYGTVRMTGFTLNKAPLANGNVLVSNSVGVGTWMPASTLGFAPSSNVSSQWTTINTNDVYLPNSGNVGIGTNKTTGGALVIMNGNVGIGSTAPGSLLDVQGTVRILNGNVGIGSATPQNPLDVIVPANNSGGLKIQVSSSSYLPELRFSNNNGYSYQYIALNPNSDFGVYATGNNQTSTVYDILSIVEPGNAGGIEFGYDSSGPRGDIISTYDNGPQNYLDFWGYNSSGSWNRIATMSGNGNVGIGTSVPRGALDIKTANNLIVEAGNVGIGSLTPGQALDVQGTVRIPFLGGSLSIPTGTNSCMGTGTLSTGTATISTACTPSGATGIFISDAGGGVLANIGSLSVGTVTAGTSFVVNSSNALDSSNFTWLIIGTK